MDTLNKISERLKELIKQKVKLGPNHRAIKRVEQDATGKLTVSFEEFEIFILDFDDQIEMHLPIMYDLDEEPIADAGAIAEELIDLLERERSGREIEVVLIDA